VFLEFMDIVVGIFWFLLAVAVIVLVIAWIAA
jgi:hypothetical protein